MKPNRTIETFFHRAIFRYAGIGFVSLVFILSAASFLLAREQAASDLRESARATAQAFKDRIIDGDIRSVEAQISNVLLLKNSEFAKILKKDHTPVYSPIGTEIKLLKCPVVGIPCFSGYFGQARIVYPISMDNANKEPFRYLYLSKSVSINWSFLVTVFLVFSLGYVALIIAFLRISKVASIRLGSEIKDWSARIKENPKDASPRQRVPFSELTPLKEALDGLNEQIEDFERTATDKAKLLILRGIAHDLLTPVSQLQLNLATLEKRTESNEHSVLLSDIKDSLKKVTGIASQVKNLKESKSTETSELVAAAQGEIQALRESDEITAKSIKLEFTSDIKKVSCSFSQTDISRIIGNLVQNAADASATGGIISVNVSSQNGMATLTVQDRGKGIPATAKSRVFDPDFTLKPGTGTGLGLAVVKYLCDKQSAKIELQSEVNLGTTITICVPVSGGDKCISY